MKPSVTTVIPTIGRPSLTRAVHSVLDQTYPVKEIIVVADTDVQVSVPAELKVLVTQETRSKLGVCAKVITAVARRNNTTFAALAKIPLRFE